MAVCEQTTRRINRNRDTKIKFTFEKDLTGYEFTLQLRKTVNAPDPALLTLTSDPAAGITVTVVSTTNGFVEVIITEAQSITLPSGVFPFDLYGVTPGNDKETTASGFMSVHDSTAI